MLRIGLSGGIGAGKSTVADRLAERGAVLVDADALAREVVAPGTEGLAALVHRFGNEVLDESGALNRPALASRVFDDEQARADLNAITHPRIAELTEQRIAAAPSDSLVVHDVPLLVEAGYATNYHLVLIVDAPEQTRVQRLVQRGLDAADAQARIRTQATPEQRRAAADVWLDNSAAPQVVREHVDELFVDRLLPFERNVRSRYPAVPSACAIVDPDPTWDAQARRSTARVRRAAADVAVRVDHIGSTAVAELPARDVLDLQLIVRSADDADGLVDALGAAGFPRVDGTSGSLEPSTATGDTVATVRVHAAADPGRPVDLHVRQLNDPGWRGALLLRDWLRAHPDAAGEYARVKREHAGDAAGGDCYMAAKRDWFAVAIARAEQWARHVGWDVPESDA